MITNAVTATQSSHVTVASPSAYLATIGISIGMLSGITLAPNSPNIMASTTEYSALRSLYNDRTYHTSFDSYRRSILTDNDKIVALNAFTESITTRSIPLTKDQHALISENLFDLM